MGKVGNTEGALSYGDPPSCRFIFASFMLACMAGSSVAARLMSKPLPAPEKYMQVVFAVSAASLLVPVWFSSGADAGGGAVGGITFEGKVQLLAFLVFEVCVGIFWPSIMSVRSPNPSPSLSL